MEFVTFIQTCGPDSRKPGSPDTSIKVQTSLNLVSVAISTTSTSRTPNRVENGIEGRKVAMCQVLDVVREIFMSEELLQSHRFHMYVYANRVVY